MNPTRILISLFVLLLCFLGITHICEAVTVDISELSRSWQPKAYAEEPEASIAWFTVSVSGITSSDHYKRVEISLQYVTKYYGTCCNSSDRSRDLDLQFHVEDYSAPIQGNYRRFTVVNQSLLRWEIPSSDLPDTVKLSVGVRCHDYAAYGELYRAVYKEKGVFKKEWVVDNSATVTGGPRQIPVDKNYNGIADSWNNDWNQATRSGNNFVDDVDVDNEIGSSHIGDNITVFEEYRGFLTSQAESGGTYSIKHIRTSPDSKDLFVVNSNNDTSDFRTGNGPPLSLHILHEDNVDDVDVNNDGEVTFNQSGNAYSVRVVSDPSFTVGDRYGQAPLGPPYPNYAVTIYVNKIKMDNGGMANSVISDTIGHELGHSVHLSHCWELADGQGVSWSDRCLMWPTADNAQNQFATHHVPDYSLTTSTPASRVEPRSDPDTDVISTNIAVISTNTGLSSYGCDHNSEHDYCTDTGNCGHPTDFESVGLCGHRWCICAAAPSEDTLTTQTTSDCGHSYTQSEASSHDAGDCGISGHYKCDSVEHVSLSCPTNSNGQSCTYTSYYACSPHTHAYPAVVVLCGNRWSGTGRCIYNRAVTSSSTEHRDICLGGHTYWSCNAGALDRHGTITCTRTGCSVSFSNCTNGNGGCFSNGTEYTWHAD